MPHAEGPFQQSRFDHRQHVKFAWTAVRDVGAHRAEQLISDEIRDFAAVHAPGKYHQTMTSFWVRLVAHTLETDDSGSFDEHIVRFPILLDKRAAWRHYSDEVLMSNEARDRYVPPDKCPLPRTRLGCGN
jgi:hypothetical protein